VTSIRRLLLTIIGLAWTASTAGAYYHFIHYTGRSAPYNPIQEKFDLNALPNKTVTFFLSDTALTLISRNDLPSAIGAMREAARAWNGVDTSDLRVAFGGLASASTPQNTPGVDIVFDEMDPLTLGLTSTNAARNSIVFGPTGSFVPITRPLVRLNRNLSVWNSPSVTEGFFLTVVHEMGHALGLQHTFTAGVMSTEAAGRATSLYAPLTADDFAGLSYLYPGRSFSQSTGGISGRVALPSGQGLHLASVVAIRPAGGAISALTDPDGRYRIDGIPPGSYLVYAHPVPAPARAGVAPGDLWLPVDPDGRQIAAEGPFDTLFYQGFAAPGTRDYSQAQTISINAGTQADNINFAPNRRAAYSISSVATYSYFGQTAVRPGFLNGGGTLVAAGSGLTSNGAPAPGLNVTFLGGGPVLKNGISAYSGIYLQLDLDTAFGGSGARHVVFTLPNDIYVQPAGLSLVQNRPPFIASATPVFESNGARSLALTGTTLNSDTKFYFDGVPATLLRFDDATRAVVIPPPGLAGLRSLITAFNPDGQNSMFLQASGPPAYTYDSGDAGVVTLSPSTLQAGTETLVEITGSGNFLDGTTAAGFGSSDVQVRRAWVITPNKIWANVWVAPNAAVTPALASVVTGFQVISQPFAAQIIPANSRTPVLSSQLVNAAPALSGVFPGASVIVSGSNLAGGTITLGDRAVKILSSNANQISFVVPLDLTPGPAILKFTNGTDSAAVAVAIDAIPPAVSNVLAPGDVIVDASHPARPGETLNVVVANLADLTAIPDARRVHVSIGGVDHAALAVTPRSGGHQVEVVLAPSVPAGQVPLTVSIDGRVSLPYYVPTRNF
jgi:uncharacterized protein (TIGR03437 family)